MRAAAWDARRTPRRGRGRRQADAVEVAATSVRLLRLVTGLILFTYLTTHLGNHALGLVSVHAMEAGRVWFLGLWRNPLGTVLLYGSLVTHFALALVAIYARRTLRMPFWEWLRLSLGLTIPFLVVPHIAGTRLSNAWFGTEDAYARVLYALWHSRPDLGLRQTILLLIAWTHVVLGLHYWLRLRDWYRRAAPFWLAGAVILPLLALLGFASGGREVARLAADPAWLPEMLRVWRPPLPANRALLDATVETTWVILALLIVGAFAARAVRNAWERRASALVRIRYADHRPDVRVPIGTTILEASRMAGIPHASVCGGRGRCSTCRVQVVRGIEHAPPASDAERRVLQRIGARPDIRLACQLRPGHDVTIVRLLPAHASPAASLSPAAPVAGEEQEIAIFFADLRRFTTLAETKLPYDVVYFLNRYFDAVGRTIEASGGITNQFTGDGVMALFGVGIGAADGCRRALAAARAVVDALATLSHALATELNDPLRVGIGIHVGPAVVGRMGYGEAMYLTAVGDTVHVASRFQDLTKQYDCQLVISDRVAALAGIDVRTFPSHLVEVRNRAQPLEIRVIDDVRRLPVGTPAPVTAAR